MRSILACTVSALLVGCSGRNQPPPAEETSGVAAPATELSSAEAKSSISDDDLGRVCRAVVADVNGHQPSIMKINSNNSGVVQVSYARPSDGKVWTNDCRVEGDRVVLRTIDAFGAGSGPGRWRTDPMDEVIKYKLDGTKVILTTTYTDGSGGTETYTVS